MQGQFETAATDASAGVALFRKCKATSSSSGERRGRIAMYQNLTACRIPEGVRLPVRASVE